MQIQLRKSRFGGNLGEARNCEAPDRERRRVVEGSKVAGEDGLGEWEKGIG
jgi:hypothetical protein